MKGAKKALLPCLLTLVAGLSACSCSGSGKNNYAYDLDFTVDVKGQKISLWNPFGSDISEILEDLCGEFTRLTGVTVDVEDKTGYDTLRDAVTKSATSGKYCNVVFSLVCGIIATPNRLFSVTETVRLIPSIVTEPL